ncbi:uncharacterized protein LOC133206405 [Saccostrea echinata]|uniref:uncharacterized protein LOC133206405 n=1 Tax=Saccostrea echinata TaxID=191078 RepID=UPI002A83EA84|nr:uncharacterized protein LOC133206405 [Saccostrea echinata]
MELRGWFLICVFVAGVWGHCCPPKQYEVTEDVYAAVKKNGAVTITRGMQRVAYDVVGKRLAVHGVDYTKNITSDVIMDYKAGKEYVWANGACRVLPLGNFSESCVPEGAKLLGRTYMGQPPNEVPVNMYNFKKDTNDMYVTVTEDCIPMEGHFSSEEKGYIEFIVYSNFSLGITNPSVFTPPNICVHQERSLPHVTKQRRRGISLI